MPQPLTGAAGAAIDDLPDLWDGFLRKVRHGLGVTAFGANVMNLPPDYSTHAHDETGTGQEELYVGLRGSGWVVLADGERLALDPEHVVAVGPPVQRTLASGPEGLRVLIIGAQPGEFIEVEGGAAREIDLVGLEQRSQLTVQWNGCATGRQPDHQGRVRSQRASDIARERPSRALWRRKHPNLQRAAFP